MSNKKVRIVAQVSGTRNGEDWPKPGETLTVSAAEAEDLIRTGIAAELNAPEENAIADVLGVEAAVANPSTKDGQKSIREQIKPAPHADEPDAYHVPVLPGEKAAAEAGQASVDAANADATATAAPRRGRAAK